jgi:hypothetical protein
MAAACSPGAGVEVHDISIPAFAGAGESNLHTGPSGTVYLTYCAPGSADGERALWVARLRPDAATWDEPTMVVDTPLLMENWADFPSLTVGTDGQLWAQWFQRPAEAGKRGYSGWFARSADDGHTWTEPEPLGHEFVTLAPLPGGRVLAAWLESLRIPKDQRVPGAATMELRARLLGPGGETLRDWVVDPDVCTCCNTRLVPLAGGGAIVVYRGRTPEEIRDNLYAVFDGETWSPPKTLHDDGWLIPGCPVNGPAIDARNRLAAAVWFTAAEGVARVQAKLSYDRGSTFGDAIPVDLGRPMGRVDLAMLEDGTSLVTWMELGSETNRAGVHARRLFPDGRLSSPVLLAESTQARASGFPRIAVRTGTQIVMTHTEEGETTRVRTSLFDASSLGPKRSSELVARVASGSSLDFCTSEDGAASHP